MSTQKKPKKKPSAKTAKTVKTTKNTKKSATPKYPRLARIIGWPTGFKKWQRILLQIVIVLVALIAVHKTVEYSIPRVKNPNYGVSFSVKYANELGVDWKQNFTALLDDMKLRNFRLMSYWDDTEPERGVFKFEDLDWQMDEAAKRGAKVSLAIGLRQPRWPECHKPAWYNELGSKQAKDDAIVAFTQAVVKRYRDHPALGSYQLENEAVNSWFGECTPEDIDQKRLEREFDAVKEVDASHPVYMSLSDQHGLPLGKPVPDRYGYSVYRIVWNEKTGPFKFYVTYPTPVWYHKLRALWIKTFKDRDIFIHELQIEPWGPSATVNLSIDEQNRSMGPKQIKENVTFARKIGTPDIYTWGGEWWYWRKTTLNDPSVWNVVKNEFNRP